MTTRRLAVMTVLAVLGAFWPAATAPVPAHAAATTPRPGWSDRTVVSGLNDPTAMAVSPDGRVFIAQRGGAIRIVKNGALLANPFVTLTVDSSGERGALGIALHPEFPVSPYVFVYYTVPGSPAHNRVSRFTISGDQFVGGSELPILDLPSLSGGTNNGGVIKFGFWDHALYIGVGDNGIGTRAQQLDNPFGKILRVTSTGAVAPGNPYVGVAGADERLFAIGFRNPSGIAFHPWSPGGMFANDAGSPGPSGHEEVNWIFGGASYGWPVHQGYSDDSQHISPIRAYDHSDGSCAITGGAFVDSFAWSGPSPQYEYNLSLSHYFYADRCGGYIEQADSGSVPLASGLSQPVDIDRSPGGGIYYLARGSGTLGEIRVNEKIYVRNSLTPGAPTTTIVQDHPARGDTMACDWNGDGDDSIGVFFHGWWYITTDGTGPVDLVIPYGGPFLDRGVCGDWNGDGIDTIGVFQNEHFFLRNSNTAGSPDIGVHYGSNNGDTPIGGDWNGDGIDTIGLYQFDHFFLRDTNTPGPPDYDIPYGVHGNDALAGDWNGDGVDTIGVYLFSHFYLRDSNTPGPPSHDIHYGTPPYRGVTGRFSGGPADRIAVTEPNA